MPKKATITPDADDMQKLLVTKLCQVTNKTYSFTISRKAYDAWSNQGVLAQNAFPELNVGQREIIISGWTPDEWNAIFPKEDDE